MNPCFSSERPGDSTEGNDSDYEYHVKAKVRRTHSIKGIRDYEDMEFTNAKEIETTGDGDDRLTDTMASALAVARGEELSSEQFEMIQRAAEGCDNHLGRLQLKYILCAQAAHHSGFIEPDYFGNLPELLSTNNVIIRKCIMWAFASILPCKNVLSPLLVRLLYKSLKDETLGWSIFYLFRKMTEYDKYIPMVADGMWVSMASLLFDGKLSEQIRTTIAHTLSNVYKIRKWVAPVIKFKFEQLIRTKVVPTRILVAVVHALHSMVIRGASLEEETISRLKNLSNTGDATSMESIYE